jgi:hypothetical protein
MKLVIPSESDAAREPERDVTSTRVPKRVPLEAGRNSRPIEPLPAITPGPARLEETITEAPPAKQPALKFERAPRNPLNPRRSNLRDGETPPSAERSPSANKPASQPVSRQSIPESEPPAKKPDEGPKGTSPSLPSLDGLEPLPTPSP